MYWDTLGYIKIHQDTLGYIRIHLDTLRYIDMFRNFSGQEINLLNNFIACPYECKNDGWCKEETGNCECQEDWLGKDCGGK